MNTIEIGKYIKSKRIEKHLTQKDIAENLQISFQAVSKWETGTTLPDTSLLLGLSDILEVSVDQILNAGEFRKSMNKKINIEEVKKGLKSVLTLKKVLGPNNGVYKKIINSVTDEDGNNLEFILADEELSEIILAKSVIQLIIDGYTLEEQEVLNHFKSKGIKDKVLKYYTKYKSE